MHTLAFDDSSGSPSAKWPLHPLYKPTRFSLISWYREGSSHLKLLRCTGYIQQSEHSSLQRHNGRDELQLGKDWGHLRAGSP